MKVRSSNSEKRAKEECSPIKQNFVGFIKNLMHFPDSFIHQ